MCPFYKGQSNLAKLDKIYEHWGPTWYTVSAPQDLLAVSAAKINSQLYFALSLVMGCEGCKAFDCNCLKSQRVAVSAADSHTAARDAIH